MAVEIVLPQLGQTMEKATIVRWLKKEGDRVNKGDILLEIETDKATLEVESFASGILLKILAKEGESVPVLEVVGYIGKPGEQLPEIKRKAKPIVTRETEPSIVPSRISKPAPEEKIERLEIFEKTALKEVPPTERRLRISPRAKLLAKETAIDLTKIHGTGPDGRIVEQDVIDYLESRNYARIKITPTAKKLARKLNLDILDIQGSGANGKIFREDVLKADRLKPRSLSRTRKIIANKMMRSISTIPHFFVTISVDMTNPFSLRDRLKKQQHLDFSFNDFILKACADTLREIPILNAVCLGDTYRLNEDINVGIAVEFEEGLIVPVIRDADKKNLIQISKESKKLVEKARSKKLTLDEFTGGTFTVSNMGMLDVENFAAIVNPDEGAVLAVGAIKDMPVARNKRVAIRKMMKMTLSCDHRIIDGATAAEFLRKVKEKLEGAKWDI